MVFYDFVVEYDAQHMLEEKFCSKKKCDVVFDWVMSHQRIFITTIPCIQHTEHFKYQTYCGNKKISGVTDFETGTDEAGDIIETKFCNQLGLKDFIQLFIYGAI
jgi:hypothetical protein